MGSFDIAHLDHFNQIGVAVFDVDKTAEFMEKTFGIKLFVITMPEAKAFLRGREVKFVTKIAIGRVGDIDLEFMEIVSGEHIVKEFLEQRGPGIHHLGIYVDDLKKAAAAWESQGGEIVQMTAHPDGIGTAYLDTEAPLGAMYIELIKM